MINKPRLLTPGPTQLPERVRFAMAQDMIHHRKAAFQAVMLSLQKGLGELFGTTQPVLPLSCSGTGGMVAAVSNLFNAGETVLVVEAGKFAERWTNIAKKNDLKTLPMQVAWGQGVCAKQLAKMLDEHPEVKGVLVQLSETSTGVQHKIHEVAAVTRKRDVLLVVDGISGVSIAPCPMDEWGVDCLITGSQKGLMLPPGLALIALSERAWQKVETVTSRDFYFNLLKERQNNLKNQTNFTSPVSLIIGLAESLAMFEEAGLDNIYRKQWAMTQMVRAGVSALGLTLFAKEDFAWGVTSILLPEGIDATKLVKHASEHYGIIFAAGQDDLKTRMVRFGHMGWLDFGDILAGLYALAASYTACGGFSACRDYLEQALEAYWNAMEKGYPKY